MFHWIQRIQWQTRMYSNGMRTARFLTVSQHALWLGGVPAQGVYLPGGVPAQVLPPWTERHLWKHNLRKFCWRVVKIFVIKARTSYLSCKRPGCYHSTSKTYVSDRIFKYLCFSDLSYFLNTLNSMKALLHLGKSPLFWLVVTFFSPVDNKKYDKMMC